MRAGITCLSLTLEYMLAADLLGRQYKELEECIMARKYFIVFVIQMI